MRLAILAILLFCCTTKGATINASSASRADVGTAYSSASDGDTIVIPAGSATWTSVLTVAKAVTIQGAGIEQTIISDNVASGPLLDWTLPANSTNRLTGISFKHGGRSSQAFNGVFTITGSGTLTDTARFRVDNCAFSNIFGVCFTLQNVIGVADHNTYVGVPTSRFANVFDSAWDGGTYSDKSWTDGNRFGTDKFFFMENNAFNYTGGANYAFIDSWTGARFVFRYNNVTNGWIELHGTDSAGRTRGARAAEIYMNTFQGDDSSPYIVNARSGVILVWSNTCAGFTASPVLELANYRNNMHFGPWGIADGTNPWDVNVGGGPFGASPFTATSGTGLTVTVSGAGWTINEWVGYSIKKTSGTAVSSLTRSSGTATVNTTGAHGLANGDYIYISGADQREYNIGATITVVDADTFTYSVDFGATPTTPATGTIKVMLGNSAAEITANTATTITFGSSGYGSQYDMRFTTGDTFNLWKVDYAMDQPGRSGGSALSGDFPSIPGGWNDQSNDPCYEWHNYEDGVEFDFSIGHASIQAGDNYVTDTEAPGYTPYTYPHPLVSGESSYSGRTPTTINRARISGRALLK